MRKAVFLALALLLCIVLTGCETPVPKLAAEDIATIRLIDATTTDFAEIPLSQEEVGAFAAAWNAGFSRWRDDVGTTHSMCVKIELRDGTSIGVWGNELICVEAGAYIHNVKSPALDDWFEGFRDRLQPQ